MPRVVDVGSILIAGLTQSQIAGVVVGGVLLVVVCAVTTILVKRRCKRTENSEEGGFANRMYTYFTANEELAESSVNVGEIEISEA
jgi:hypothetical protein